MTYFIKIHILNVKTTLLIIVVVITNIGGRLSKNLMGTIYFHLNFFRHRAQE